MSTENTSINRLSQASAQLQRVKLLMRRRWWVLVLAGVIGIAIQAWRSSTVPDSYESFGRLVAGGRILMDQGVRYTEEANVFYKTQQQIIESSEVRKRAEEYVAATQPELASAAVDLKVYRDKASSIFDLRAAGADREYTKALLDGVLTEYIKYRSEIRGEHSANTLDALTQQIYRIEQQVESAEDELTEFTAQNNIVVLEQGGNSAAAYLAKLKTQLANFETEIDLLARLDIDQNIDRRAAELTSSPGLQAQSTEAANANTLAPGALRLQTDRHHSQHIGPEADYLRARQALEVLKVERASLANLKHKNPDLIDLEIKITQQKALIEIFRQQSVEKFAQRRDALALQVENLNDEIAEWEGRAIETSKKLNAHKRIQDKLARSQELHERLVVSLRELDINKNLEQENIRIMQHATDAHPPESTLPKQLAIGLALGLLAGGAILTGMDYVDDRVNSAAEFQNNFEENVLAQIPNQEDDIASARLQENDPRSLFAEAYRNLRSSILFKRWGGAPPKTILVTSAVPAEGKTTVATNLATTMALSGARVLLIDGDLRRGILAESFNISGKTGFADILTDRADWREVIKKTNIEGLHVIPRGHFAKGQEASSERFLAGTAPKFLKETHDLFDYVIIDSAPVLVADDTATFAPMVDTTLFVMRMSSTMGRLSAKALEVLYARQVHIAGAVLNRATTPAKEYAYYGYGKYYKEA